MRCEVKIYITLKKSVLDPQGVTIKHALESLGYQGVEDARLGKYMVLAMEGADEEAVGKQVEEMCGKLLVNPVIEDYTYEVTNLGNP